VKRGHEGRFCPRIRPCLAHLTPILSVVTPPQSLDFFGRLSAGTVVGTVATVWTDVRHFRSTLAPGLFLTVFTHNLLLIYFVSPYWVVHWLTQPVTKLLADGEGNDASQFEGCQTARVETEQRGPLLPSPCQPPLPPFRSSDADSPTKPTLYVDTPLRDGLNHSEPNRHCPTPLGGERRGVTVESSETDTPASVALTRVTSARSRPSPERALSDESDSSPTYQMWCKGWCLTNGGYGDAVRLSTG
jgi:hypothetical protein